MKTPIKAITPGREMTFAGFDKKTYAATVLERPRCGLVKVRYCVRGVGAIEAPVPTSRLSVMEGGAR